MGNAGAFDRAAHAFGDNKRFRHWCLGEDDNELFAAEAERVIGLAAQFRLDDAGDAFEAKIASLMPRRFVEEFEMIDVEQDNRELDREVELPTGGESFFERAPVAETGQRVAAAYFVEF